MSVKTLAQEQVDERVDLEEARLREDSNIDGVVNAIYALSDQVMRLRHVMERIEIEGIPHQG